ncbi:hypothetical protein AB0J38_25075 [Streptomyces sp. NPDC050095]|uniref:hypothetical protein n=1 Tax=unclassified Streptomyces TaxID=2593676 RepID=UPI003436881C
MAARLGLSLKALYRLHPTDSTGEALAQLVVRAARRLDRLHQDITARAAGAADYLTRVAHSSAMINSLGVLQNQGLQLDLLAARHADAAEYLDELIYIYEHFASATPVSKTPRPPQAVTSTPSAGGPIPPRRQ